MRSQRISREHLDATTRATAMEYNVTQKKMARIADAIIMFRQRGVLLNIDQL